MSQGIAVTVRRGLVDPRNLYAKIKNGNVYRFNTMLEERAIEQLQDSIAKEHGRIRLKYWVLVKRIQ